MTQTKILSLLFEIFESVEGHCHQDMATNSCYFLFLFLSPCLCGGIQPIVGVFLQDETPAS